MTPVLSLSDLAVRFGGNRVLDSVTLDVPAGFTGLVGPNGAGKTTIFNVVSGYVRPVAGNACLSDETLLGHPPAEVARRGVGRTFQTPRLVAGLTVLENVMLGLDGRAGAGGHLRALLGSRRHSRSSAQMARELLERFGIGARSGEAAETVPLPVRKVVEVARALIARPRVVLLDEPAAGLAAGDLDRMVAPLIDIAAQDGLAVLIIEHDLALVSRLCSRVAVLHRGTVIALGAPAEVLGRPAVVDAYLGAGFASLGS